MDERRDGTLVVSDWFRYVMHYPEGVEDASTQYLSGSLYHLSTAAYCLSAWLFLELGRALRCETLQAI
jgi:hypothetical protein